jgi:hypothetical protein
MVFDPNAVSWTPEQFCVIVDGCAVANGFDPTLPELLELKDRADELVLDMPSARQCLQNLNLSENVEKSHGKWFVRMRSQYRVLRPWTVARAKIPNLDEQVTHIYCDRAGVSLCRKAGHLITIRGSGLANYDAAVALISQFAGEDHDFESHRKHAREVIALRYPDGWYLSSVPKHF